MKDVKIFVIASLLILAVSLLFIVVCPTDHALADTDFWEDIFTFWCAGYWGFWGGIQREDKKAAEKCEGGKLKKGIIWFGILFLAGVICFGVLMAVEGSASAVVEKYEALFRLFLIIWLVMTAYGCGGMVRRKQKRQQEKQK